MKKIIFTALVASAFFSNPIFAAGTPEGAGGQGAIAGSASMYLQKSGAEVSHVSSSIAVGKANAYTTGDIVLNSSATDTDSIDNSVTNTSALGTGGKITISTGNTAGTISVASELLTPVDGSDPTTGLNTAQANKMRAATVDLNTTAADNNPSFNGLVK